MNIVESIVIVMYWGVFCFCVLYLLIRAILWQIVKIKSIKSPLFKEYLEEERNYQKEMQKQSLDYKHDRKLLADIHREKMREIEKRIVNRESKVI